MRNWKWILPCLALGFALGTMVDLGRSSRARAQSRPPACDVELELVALVYAPDDPTLSMALVGAKRGSLLRLGSWLGERQVIGIGPRTLVLGPVDDPCQMRLTERSKQRPAPSKRRGRRSRRR